MIPELVELLRRERAPFEVIEDREIRPVRESALAKVVMLRDGDSYAMAVVSAAARLDLVALQRQLHRYSLALASTDEPKGLVPDCEIGAMPPFGRLFGLPVYLDRRLAGEADMVFKSGTLGERVSMPMGEYVRVERPGICPIAQAGGEP